MNKLSLKAASICISAIFTIGLTFAAAQEPGVSHQREVYQQINAGEDQMEKVQAVAKSDGMKVSLTGRLEDGQLQKIVASPGIGGPGSDEFYLERGEPVFVFSSIKRNNGRPIEERIYLEDGEIVKWLSSDSSFVPHAEDFAAMQKRISEDVQRYAEALGRGAKNSKQSGNTVEGVFTGIDQGDYAHWNMRANDGSERSFFILQTDAAIDRVLADPQEYEGHKCIVRWERRSEDIPEAGGRMDIDVLLGVTWK